MSELTVLPDMTPEEAKAKHSELKAIHGVARSMMMEMHDRKGWKALGYESWEEYGEKEWDYGKNYLNKLTAAARTQRALGTIVPKEIPESQLRPLTSLTDEEKKKVWEQVTAEHEVITAKKVELAVSAFKAEAEIERAEAESLRLKIAELEAAQEYSLDKITPSIKALISDGLITEELAYRMSVLMPQAQDQQAARIRADQAKLRAAEKEVEAAKYEAALASSKILAAIEEKDQIKKDFETAVEKGAQEVIRRKERELEDLKEAINTDMEKKMRARIELEIHDLYQSQIKAAEKKAKEAIDAKALMAAGCRKDDEEKRRLSMKVKELEAEFEVNTPDNIDKATAAELVKESDLFVILAGRIAEKGDQCRSLMPHSWAVVDGVIRQLAAIRNGNSEYAVIDQ